MKTGMFLIAVFLGCNIGADAGSFNLSFDFNPGISFVRTHSLQQKYQGRNSEDDDANSDWPQSDNINNFVVPEYLNDPVDNGIDIIPDESEDRYVQNYRSHHRTHRY